MSDIHRHDISNHIWLALKPHLPGSKGNRGRRGHDNRLFLNAVLWKLRTGCPYRLPMARPAAPIWPLEHGLAAVQIMA